jgi:hypothetical protein
LVVNPKSSTFWTYQSWFLAPKYYYARYVFERGSMEVYHHSIRADYDISVEFTGTAQGTVDVKSKGNVIIDGAIKNATVEILRLKVKRPFTIRLRSLLYPETLPLKPRQVSV